MTARVNERGRRLHWGLALLLSGLLLFTAAMVCLRVLQVNSARSELRSRGIDPLMMADSHLGSHWVLSPSTEQALWGMTAINADSTLTDAQWAAALPLMQKLPNVRLIALEQTPITRATLKSLARFPGLEHLLLSGCNISDDDLNTLNVLSALRSLDLSGTQVTGSGLRALQSLPQLSHLNLDGTPLNEQGLSAIATLSQLQSLSLSNVGLAESDVAQLDVALPGVMISDD